MVHFLGFLLGLALINSFLADRVHNGFQKDDIKWGIFTVPIRSLPDVHATIVDYI